MYDWSRIMWLIGLRIDRNSISCLQLIGCVSSECQDVEMSENTAQ